MAVFIIFKLLLMILNFLLSLKIMSVFILKLFSFFWPLNMYSLGAFLAYLNQSINSFFFIFSGNVVTMECVEKIIKKDWIHPLTSQKLTESDIIPLQRVRNLTKKILNFKLAHNFFPCFLGWNRLLHYKRQTGREA